MPTSPIEFVQALGIGTGVGLVILLVDWALCRLTGAEALVQPLLDGIRRPI